MTSYFRALCDPRQKRVRHSLLLAPIAKNPSYATGDERPTNTRSVNSSGLFCAHYFWAQICYARMRHAYFTRSRSYFWKAWNALWFNCPCNLRIAHILSGTAKISLSVTISCRKNCRNSKAPIRGRSDTCRASPTFIHPATALALALRPRPSPELQPRWRQWPFSLKSYCSNTDTQSHHTDCSIGTTKTVLSENPL